MVDEYQPLNEMAEIELPDDQGSVPAKLVMSEQPPDATSGKAEENSPQPVLVRFPPLSSWGIAGIEATQATQFFLINGQGSGAGANNSIPMVERKELILRVYPIRTFGLLPSPAMVTGVISRPGKPDLTPINGPVAVQFTSAVQRNDANYSLNFRVPAADCIGVVTFTVRLIDVSNASNVTTRNLTLVFDQVPQVRVHGVLIHYTGRGLDIAAPSGFDLVDTLVWVARTYPISGFNYTACEVVEFNGDLTVGGGGGCGTGWNQLFNMLWNMRAASGTNDVFVGLLPSGVPTSGVIGCGGGGVAIAYNGGGQVLAQEIGHAFGRAHAPCGNPGGVDSNYPTYNSYPSGSIGEFGFDTSSSQVYNPASTYDYMSYCGPVWTSPYTYVGLKNAITASPAAAHRDRAGARVVAGEYLFLNFRMYKDDRVEVLSGFHLYTPSPPMETGRESSVGCDLLDKDGNVIESHRCGLTNPHHDEKGASTDFHEVIRWCEKTHTIAFYRNGKKCHTTEVEEEGPQVAFTATKQLERRPEMMRLEWDAKQAAHGKGAQKLAHYILRYRNDAGGTWRPVAANLTDTSHVVNLDMLPGGEECMFQVVASSGIRTAVANTDPFAVPRKPNKAHILSPEKSGVTFEQGEEVVFLGGGFSPDFGTTEFDDVVWTSNRDGIIGTGYQVVSNRLSTGKHRISIMLPDGLGGEASASVYVSIK